jgi:hypothetical protein
VPYRGGKLTALCGSKTWAAPTRRAVMDLADAGGRELTDRARRNTPRQTGRLAEKWEQLPVKRVPEGAQSGAQNEDFRMLFIEAGTDPHRIEPRRAEALDVPAAGEPRAGVDHPGHEGAHPLARAAAETEAELPAIAAPALRRWADEVEAEAATHPGVTRTG